MDQKLTSLEKLLMETDEAIAGTSGLQNAQSSSEESDDYNDSEIQDNQLEQTKISKPPIKKEKQSRSRIPNYLKGLMGEANLRFARGDYETAEKMCFEVIRQCPDAYEPYLTLAQLYENAYPAKSFQYYSLAAHMRPSDSNQWVRMAEANVAMGNLKEAISCYSKAINAATKNVKLQMKRIELLEAVGDSKALLRSKARLAQTLKSEKHAQIIQLATEVAQEYHAKKEYEKAIDAVSIPFKKCPEHVSPELVNMLLELLLLTQNYSRCLDIFLEFCSIEIVVVVGEDNKIKVVSFSMPENLPIDLKIKFIVCLIKLESFDLLPPLVDKILIEEDVEVVGDLFLDVAEAFMAVDKPHEALKFLIPLVKSKNFSLAAVWLKHAECLKACGLLEQSVESYYMVMSLAPQHVEVRYPLALLLLQLNRKEEALSVVSQNPATQKLDVRILVEKLRLLKEMGDIKEYCKAAELLLARHCTIVRYPEELRAVIHGSSRPWMKLNKLKKMREFRGETLDPTPEFLAEHETTNEEEFDLLKDILQTCRDNGCYNTMQKLAFSAMSSTKLKHPLGIYDTGILAFFSSLYNYDYHHAYTLVREFVLRNIHNQLAWNLMSLALQRSEEVRHHKFMLRVLKSLPLDSFVSIVDANYAMAAGNYNYAIQNYMQLFRNIQSPFLCLVLGVAMLPFCGPNDGMDKKKITTTVIALFARYGQRRGEVARNEVKYNLGRLFHQLGVIHVAESFYKDVLEYSNPLIEEHSNILCLKREAAFNLHVIYKACENYDLARDVLMKYIVI